MIKLYDGQITDLLPEKIAKDTETRCLSYAIQQEHQRILKMADRTRTLAVIDELPEKILDVLAVELRTPYYQEDMEIGVKRNIIKRTLLWHTKAGTPSAVAELIEIVFGEGKVVEWFNYEEAPYTPGTFDIVTNARMTEEIATYFLSIIQRVKNTRSHIRRILIERALEMKEYVAIGAFSEPEDTILNHSKQTTQATMAETVGVAIVASPERYATNSPQGRTQSLEMAHRAAVGAHSSPEETIGNSADPVTTSATGTVYAAAGAYADTETNIYNGAFEASVDIKAAPMVAVGIATDSTITI